MTRKKLIEVAMPLDAINDADSTDEDTAIAVDANTSVLNNDLDPENDLTFLRVKCKKYEMMIAPDKDYFLIVI